MAGLCVFIGEMTCVNNNSWSHWPLTAQPVCHYPMGAVFCHVHISHQGKSCGKLGKVYPEEAHPQYCRSCFDHRNLQSYYSYTFIIIFCSFMWRGLWDPKQAPNKCNKWINKFHFPYVNFYNICPYLGIFVYLIHTWFQNMVKH